MYNEVNLHPLLSERIPRFETWPVHVRFQEDKITLGQVFLPAVRFSAVRIIPTMTDIQTHLKNVLMRDRSGGNIGTFKLSNFLSGYRRAMERNIFSYNLSSVKFNFFWASGHRRLYILAMPRRNHICASSIFIPTFWGVSPFSINHRRSTATLIRTKFYNRKKSNA